MEPETLTALKKSIQKWESIAAGIGIDVGTDNCALCQTFCCHDCPVAKAVGYNGCIKTPYNEWSNHHEFSHQRYTDDIDKPMFCLCPTCRDLANQELAFLKSLLPEGKTDHDN